MKKRYQVFVSSTYTDLIEQRQAAVEAILTEGHIPAGMELFAASNQSQWEIIKKWIDDSDIYMLILGGRYGSVDPSTGKSYTHLEYEYAKKLGKPSFCIVMDETLLPNLAVKDIERDNPELLQGFRQEVTNNMVEFFKNSTELQNAVFKSLRYIEKNFENELVGWIRADGTQIAPCNEPAPRTPKLELKINKGEDITLKTLPCNQTVVRHHLITEIPEYLQDFLSQKMVDEYNDKVGSINYDEYDALKTELHKHTHESLPLVIDLANIGSCLAEKTKVIIEFPDIVSVKEDEDINTLIADWNYKLEQVENIKNPIDLAYEKYERSKRSYPGSVISSLDILNSSVMDVFKTVKAPNMVVNESMHVLKKIPNPNFLHYTEGNKIVIKLKELMHEECVRIEDCSLIPKKDGEGVIKIALHCKEYSRSERFEVAIRVISEI